MTMREALDRSNPNALPDHFRKLGLGQLIAGSLIQQRRKFNFNAAGTSAKHVATLHHMPLDNGMKAASILRATVRAGGVTGELTPQAYGATPASTQIAVAPNGDIVVLAADAITDCDVVYVPERLDELTLDLIVDPATGVGAIPAVYVTQGVVLLMEANVTAGGVTGQKRILVPGGTNPATPQARLSVAKSAVNFTAADAVTKATVKLGLVPKKDVYALLIGAEDTV